MYLALFCIEIVHAICFKVVIANNWALGLHAMRTYTSY